MTSPNMKKDCECKDCVAKNFPVPDFSTYGRAGESRKTEAHMPEMNKSCCSGHPCKYRCQDTCFMVCKYDGYCDYQLPKDSRMQVDPYIPIAPYQQCTCGTSSSIPCPIHGRSSI